jgi:hypothetical protein
MTPHHHRKWSVAGLCRDDQAIADVRAQAASGGGGHASRRLADGEKLVVRTFRFAPLRRGPRRGPKGPHYVWREGPHYIWPVERTLHEHAGIDSTNTGLDD